MESKVTGTEFLDANHFRDADNCMTCSHADKYSRARSFCKCGLAYTNVEAGKICDQFFPEKQG